MSWKGPCLQTTQAGSEQSLSVHGRKGLLQSRGLSAHATRPQQHEPHPHHGPHSHTSQLAQGIQPSPEHPILPGFNTHHHPAPCCLPHSVLLQATPSLCGPRREGRRHRQAPIRMPVKQDLSLPCRRPEDVHFSVYARTHTPHSFVHSNFYKLKIHTQSAALTRRMNLKTQ